MPRRPVFMRQISRQRRRILGKTTVLMHRRDYRNNAAFDHNCAATKSENVIVADSDARRTDRLAKGERLCNEILAILVVHA